MNPNSITFNKNTNKATINILKGSSLSIDSRLQNSYTDLSYENNKEK
jgi:hypothetical protein